MSNKTIKEIQAQHAQWLKSVGWFKNKLPLESLFLINEELVEVGREFRQKVVDKERVADELADIVLRTAGVAEEQDIDLQAAIIRKMEINKARGTRGRVK